MMKQYLAEWLIWLSDVALALADELYPKPDVDDPITLRVRSLVSEQEQYDARSGEAKRYQVMKILAREYPNITKRYLALVLEQEVNKL